MTLTFIRNRFLRFFSLYNSNRIQRAVKTNSRLLTQLRDWINVNRLHISILEEIHETMKTTTNGVDLIILNGRFHSRLHEVQNNNRKYDQIMKRYNRNKLKIDQINSQI